MRFKVMTVLTPALLIGSCAASAPDMAASPFGVSPVADDALASTIGTGEPRWRTSFRLSDELTTSSFRQTASIGSTIKDLWLIDVASPLIASNVRAAPAR